MVKRVLYLTLFFFSIVSAASPAGAEEWSQAYVKALPDSAFAAIETTRDGKKVRHLPHHDASGALDIPHLKNARARLKQVKWVDPFNESRARDHLEQHWQEYLKFVERGRHGQ